MRFPVPAVSLSLLALAAITPSALADFIVPNGTNVPWTRGAANSTYAQWEVFGSAAGPNTPDVGSQVGGSLPVGAPAFNAYDASGASFVTSGGNIYSFSGPLNIHVITPSFELGATAATTILLQVRTQGTEILAGSVSIGGVLPTETTELQRTPQGGPGGFVVDTLYRWELTGNVASYDISFAASGAHMSADRIAIDSYTAVPAPAGVAMLGLGGLVALRRRR